VDLAATLPVAFNTRYRDFQLTLSYLPALLYSDIAVAKDRGTAFQQAGVGRLFFTKTIKRLTVSTFVAGTYTAGKTTVTNQLIPPPTTGRGPTTPTATPPLAVSPTFPVNSALVVPPDTIVKTATGSAGAGFTYRFNRRLTFASSAFGSHSEGVDYYSRVLSPPTSIVGGSVDLTEGLSRRDDISTRVIPTYTVAAIPLLGNIPANTVEATIVSVLESYRHQWSLRTLGRISAGINVATARSTQAPATTVDTSFAADASLDHSMPFERGGTIALRAAAAYGLALNQFSGTLQEQLSGLGAIAMTKRDVSAVLSVSATTSVDATPTTSSVAAGLVTTYRFTPFTSVFAGVTLSESLLPPQSVAAFNASNPNGLSIANGTFQWLALAGVTLLAPPIVL
jgi:hypothetical protein